MGDKNTDQDVSQGSLKLKDALDDGLGNRAAQAKERKSAQNSAPAKNVVSRNTEPDVELETDDDSPWTDYVSERAPGGGLNRFE